MRHWLHAHIKHWTLPLVALAPAGVLALAGVALGAVGSVPGFSFSPSTGVGNVYTPGKLSVRVTSGYFDSSKLSRLQLRLDDDFQFNPDTVPKCLPSDLSGNLTMKQALQKCGPPAGAAKNAWLWPVNSLTSNGTAQFCCGGTRPPGPTDKMVKGCMLVFNGQGSTSEVLLFFRVDALFPSQSAISCADPVNNTEGDVSFVLTGDLKTNPGIGADFTDPDGCSPPGPRQGCEIDFNNVAAGALRTDVLDISLQRGKYIRARCVDPPTPPSPNQRRWNLSAVFTYVDPPGTQAVQKSQACT